MYMINNIIITSVCHLFFNFIFNNDGDDDEEEDHHQVFIHPFLGMSNKCERGAWGGVGTTWGS